MPERKYQPKDYKEDIHNDWCPGCGDFGIVNALQLALSNLGLPPHRVAIVSGIGCSGKTPHYMNACGFHTLHGRVMPSVIGLKLANPSLEVIGVGGDGDGYGIGAGHFVNGGRRNLDITYIVFNNDVYALTKGQASPTIARGKKTKSMPLASMVEAINPVALALACGYTFIARGYALDIKHLADLIVQGVEHRGTALIDVLQTCPTYNDLHTKSWYQGKDMGRPRLYRLEEEGYDPVVADPDDPEEVRRKKLQALERSSQGEDRIGLGVYYKINLPTYEDHLAGLIPGLKQGPLAELDLFHRDVTPLLDQLA